MMPAQPVSSDSHVFGNLPNVKKIEEGGNVYTDFKSTGTRTFDDRRCCGDWALIQLGLGLDGRLACGRLRKHRSAGLSKGLQLLLQDAAVIGPRSHGGCGIGAGPMTRDIWRQKVAGDRTPQPRGLPVPAWTARQGGRLSQAGLCRLSGAQR